LFYFVTDNPWSIDSVIAIRERFYDENDDSRTTGYISYTVEVYGFNKTSLAFNVENTDVFDKMKHQLITQVECLEYYVKEPSDQGRGYDSYDRFIHSQRKVYINKSVADTSQLFAAHKGAAAIDRAFDDKTLGVIIHTSHGSIKALVSRYFTRDRNTSGEGDRNWVLSKSKDYFRWAVQIAQSDPDSAIVLLSKAVRLDDLNEEAYELLAQIYRERGEVQKADEIMFDYSIALDQDRHSRFTLAPN
jgi:tetratricopeptide (TPR) repeat protein